MKNFDTASGQTTHFLTPISIEELTALFRQIVQEELAKYISKKSADDSNIFRTPGLVSKPLYKMREVCTYFGVSRQTIYGWMRQGKLKAYKVHSRVYFLAADVAGVLG